MSRPSTPHIPFFLEGDDAIHGAPIHGSYRNLGNMLNRLQRLWVRALTGLGELHIICKSDKSSYTPLDAKRSRSGSRQ